MNAQISRISKKVSVITKYDNFITGWKSKLPVYLED